MGLAPVIRFAIAASALALAVVGGYFSADLYSKVFLFGASIMVLTPLTFVALLDVVRRKVIGEGRRSGVIGVALAIPLAVLALCSAAIGVYLLVPLLVGPGPNTWPNILAGVLLALVLIGFSIRLFRVVWRRLCRHHPAPLRSRRTWREKPNEAAHFTRLPFRMKNKQVQIELTADEALVLFEFLHRFGETDKLSLADQAEERALWNLSCLLEKKLIEPFSSSYGNLLAQARARLRDEKA